jgi:uncharacterized protein DUF4233
VSGTGAGRLFYGVPERMTRRFAAIVIASQGLVVFFWALVAHGLAATRGGSDPGSFLLIGGVVAVLCILDAGLLRRPWGVTLGWLLELATLAMALVVPAMVVVGLVFLALWVVALVQGRRMDALTADYLARTGTDDTSAHG